jgi:ABC-type glutathione transport system ATPase component
MKLAVNIEELRLSASTEEKVLLKDINFVLVENGAYTILGRNGSGKSTLIRSLARLLDKRFYKVKGSVVLDNINLYSASEAELLKLRRGKIKYVFQDAINSFDQLRKLEYYFKRFDLDMVSSDKMLSYFLLPPLSKISKMYPYELSGGMAQRFSLALALLMNPELLILDEPTSGIDPAIANLILLKLKEFAAVDRKTVLLVTQDIKFARSLGGFTGHISDGSFSGFKPSQEYFSSSEILFKNSQGEL